MPISPDRSIQPNPNRARPPAGHREKCQLFALALRRYDPDQALGMRPGLLLLPWSMGMSGVERFYQIDQLLASCRFVTRDELLRRLGVS